MTLQYTYSKNQRQSFLTYEASMTRLFREGHTETVGSCTVQSFEFVRSMLDKSKTPQERLQLLCKACDKHQELYKDAMCGQGVNRHLFALYVIKRFSEEESPFFDNIFPGTYLLFTSQTQKDQCEADAKGLSDEVRLIIAGEGFGPVADQWCCLQCCRRENTLVPEQSRVQRMANIIIIEILFVFMVIFDF
ncbi:hypothetical protein CAEBREN_24110 [Caenorhabditis brenneri]|uniref:Choline/carnitine acyltransferase domain-containing protein n=1 Tax=Caenorhabditis brenneri TaxID=135651 RepID=G0P0K4_CAEBE|nr:hypothetical protein CAEBREN_24110 [Caenorhabditis brenneri]